MKILVGVVLGFFSGFLLYMMGAMVLANPDRSDKGLPALVFVLLIGGWIVSGWLLIRGAQTTAKVFSRGFLLGAAEWLAMIFAGIIFAGKTSIETANATGDAGVSAGVAVGSGLVSIVTGAFSFFMALVCLTFFAVSYFWNREMKKEPQGKQCPMCAETVQAQAVMCRFCGAPLRTEQA